MTFIRPSSSSRNKLTRTYDTQMAMIPYHPPPPNPQYPAPGFVPSPPLPWRGSADWCGPCQSWPIAGVWISQSAVPLSPCAGPVMWSAGVAVPGPLVGTPSAV